ncbi:transposase [Marinithermofilum abyssi]|uniref:transposase n=1 Tax=Marinithermofilum abyssi TaxID=1571185 RepID=UPI00357175E8
MKGVCFMGRRKWSAEKKMEIVLEEMTPGANISEVCRRHGCPDPVLPVAGSVSGRRAFRPSHGSLPT